MKKILIIQTAFIGDVILTTSIIKELSEIFPDVRLDFLLRKGNEGILANNPHVRHVICWNKNEHKYKSLFRILKEIRKGKYDLLINYQRFASSGFLTACSKAKKKIGYKKNPWSFLFSQSFEHSIDPFAEIHEIERLFHLISTYTRTRFRLPKLYPGETDYTTVKPYQKVPYICIAPASVWFTKQFPKEMWIKFLNEVPGDLNVYLIGGPGDHSLCRELIEKSNHQNMLNLSGKLSILESAALMQNARMNYVNDSAPLHIASAMNAPVAAIFCSTIPGFGFGPASEKGHIIQIDYHLACRPCGLHGKKECPKDHFKCGYDIDISKMLKLL